MPKIGEPGCTAGGCGRVIYSRQLCQAHCNRLRRTGSLQLDKPIKEYGSRKGLTCSVNQCDNPVFARGMCNPHYSRVRNNGDARPSDPFQVQRKGALCAVDGCQRRSRRRGFCNSHHGRWKRNGDVQAHVPLKTLDSSRTCTESGCEGKHYALGICKSHYFKYFVAPRRRHQMKETAAITFTVPQLHERMSMFRNRCWICQTGPFEHIDHVKPLVKGGPHILANLRPACAKCNCSKSATWPFVPPRKERIST